MKYSQLFGKTFRENPHEVKAKSQKLLVQAGYVRFLGQGLYSYLPLGTRVLNKLMNVIRDEMESLGGQEVKVPLVNPRELWRRGGREAFIDRGMIHFSDRTGRELVLAPSHEEAMVDLVRQGLRSYRDLPIFLYQFQSKFRDEQRARYGLIRSKEFIMKDAYSFHRTYHELNNFFPRVFAAYERIFRACEIDILTAESGVGYMGGEKAYEFLMASNEGDDVVIVCPECGYCANQEIAKAIKQYDAEEALSTEEVATPGCNTIERVAAFLSVPKAKIGKALVYRTATGFVMAIVRADYDVSIEKLTNCLRQPIYRPANSEELADLGLPPGFLSPLCDCPIPVIVDESIERSANLVFGSNKGESHIRNVNFPRDFQADVVADIAMVNADDRCLQCHGQLTELHAVELGNIFKLTDFYSKAMSLHFQDDSGNQMYPHMGSYGIGLGRLISAVVEAHADERGIRWPGRLAPFRAYLMGIGRSPAIRRLVDQIHDFMPREILLDDRMESPGVKFKDADLIGIPMRIVVAPRLLEQKKVEVCFRRNQELHEVAPDEVRGMLSEVDGGAGFGT